MLMFASHVRALYSQFTTKGQPNTFLTSLIAARAPLLHQTTLLLYVLIVYLMVFSLLWIPALGTDADPKERVHFQCSTQIRVIH